MAFLTQSERSLLEAVSRLAYCNPFLPERIEFERQVLGDDFEPGEPVWSLRVEDPQKIRTNAWKVKERVEAIADALRDRLQAGNSFRDRDLTLYEDAILYMLFQRYVPQFFDSLKEPRKAMTKQACGFYSSFLRDWRYFLEVPGRTLPSGHEAGHTFACFFQITRAFLQIFENIIGGSLSAARLRAAIWQSIFTHDMRRYRRTLYAQMGDFATLITGPSGTGKELVARAIAMSRYVPFDQQRLVFVSDWSDSFHAINLAALSPTLIESELFGHRRGAFTGAVQDRKGWLEACPPLGSVFLDEIGDLDVAIQVKLLRVIETRTFQPVGDNKKRQFHGKLIAATNRDLSALIAGGRFREDFYYRLCSDQIRTPSLREQIRENPEVLHEIVLFMARRVAKGEAEPLAAEVERWIQKHLGLDFDWSGNFRELEQCVRNIAVRERYDPPARWPSSGQEELARAFEAGTLSADALLCRYCALVYSRTGSYEETARRLQIDRRTVKSRVEKALLDSSRN